MLHGAFSGASSWGEQIPTIACLDEVVGGPSALVGWSDGAVVGALWLYFPDTL